MGAAPGAAGVVVCGRGGCCGAFRVGGGGRTLTTPSKQPIKASKQPINDYKQPINVPWWSSRDARCGSSRNPRETYLKKRKRTWENGLFRGDNKINKVV